MQWTARSLIANEQGGPFPLLSVATQQPPKCRTLTALVVHAAAVLFSKQKLEVLWPFLNMLTDPAKLAVSEFILDLIHSIIHVYYYFRMPTFLQWPKITYKKQDMLSEEHSMVFRNYYFVAKNNDCSLLPCCAWQQLVQGVILTLLVK